MHEADQMSDEAGVLHNDRLVAEGTPKEVAAIVDRDVALEIDAVEFEPSAIKELRKSTDIQPVSASEHLDGDTRLRVLARDKRPPREAIVSALSKHGFPFASLESSASSLEDAFVALTDGDPDACIELAHNVDRTHPIDAPSNRFNEVGHHLGVQKFYWNATQV